MWPSCFTHQIHLSFYYFPNINYKSFFPLPVVLFKWLLNCMQFSFNVQVKLFSYDCGSIPTTLTNSNCANIRRICFVCKDKSALRCSNCNSVNYCSQLCQISHWKYHKKVGIFINSIYIRLWGGLREGEGEEVILLTVFIFDCEKGLGRVDRRGGTDFLISF